VVHVVVAGLKLADQREADEERGAHPVAHGRVHLLGVRAELDQQPADQGREPEDVDDPEQQAHGFHGRHSNLEELAEALGGAAKRCYVYLGACLTLFDKRALEGFLTATEADAVLGYRKEVDWVEAAAFEVLLLSWMANHTGRPKTLFDQLMTRYGDLAMHLKFVVGTRTGVWRAQDHRPPAAT